MSEFLQSERVAEAKGALDRLRANMRLVILGKDDARRRGDDVVGSHSERNGAAAAATSVCSHKRGRSRDRMPVYCTTKVTLTLQLT